MFRIGLKYPVNDIYSSQVKKYGFKRIHSVSKTCQYTVNNGQKYRRKAATIATLSAAAFGAIGILAYAKKDFNFRNTLEKWIPGTENAIKILFQEQSSYLDHVNGSLASLKQKIFGIILENESKKSDQIKTTDGSRNSSNYKFADIPKSLNMITSNFNKKPLLDLYELEKYGREVAIDAINAFQYATCAVYDFNDEASTVAKSTTADAGLKIWDRLKVAQDKRTQAIAEAEKKADEAVEILKRLHKSIEDPNIDATLWQKTIAKKNITQILSDLDVAKQNFKHQVECTNISETYWENIKNAREKFHDELKILFPNFNISEKKFFVSSEAFDLFLLHTYDRVTFLQRELEKIQNNADVKLKSALNSENDTKKIEEIIALQVSKESRELEEQYKLRELKERKVLDDKLRKQLKLQSQVHVDHLKDVIVEKERELDRKIIRALDEQTEFQTVKTKTQLASVIGKLQGLDKVLKHRWKVEKDANNSQLMLGACQVLSRALEAAPLETLVSGLIGPLKLEIEAIATAAAKNDAFVKVTVKGIPEEAVKRGVYAGDALRERFRKVEQICRKLALIPDEGSLLPVYILSYLQSFLLFKTASLIPKSVLNDEPINVDALNTNEVLQRARYWLDCGNLKMTLRYMNLLKGAPRSVSVDWINEAIILLETQQAVDSLAAHASANSSVFISSKDRKKQIK